MTALTINLWRDGIDNAPCGEMILTTLPAADGIDSIPCGNGVNGAPHGNVIDNLPVA